MICPRCRRDVPEGSKDCPVCAASDVTATLSEDATHPGHANAPRDAAIIGSVLAERYRIVAFAGRGGMAEVYRADDLKLGQTVAIKLLPEAVGRDEHRMARLLNEVRTARQVTHPNVCRVYDVGEAEGRRFLSMEWIEGENLADLLERKGRLRGEAALRLARQLCAGLAAAHDRGVIHRDLKPSNVMIDERGVARLTDFGVAEAAEVVRGSRAREGTPEYMAPEQLAGQEATARSDIYALGLLLYEIFTGRPAHAATTSAELAEGRRAAASPPSALAPDVDPAVDRAIVRCLAPTPRHRPGSARLVADALPGDDAHAEALLAAQRRADRIEAFRSELAELRVAGLLKVGDPEVAAIERYHEGVLRDLVQRFDVDLGERGKNLSLGMRIASFVGALALATSAFYFLSSVWGAIALPLQVGILAAAPLVALAATSAIAARETGRYVTMIAGTLALACFVVNVTVLGDTFAMSASPSAFLGWGVFALILAYGYGLRLPLVLGLASLATFVSGSIQEATGRYWAGAFERSETFLPAGAAIFALAFIARGRQPPGFPRLYRIAGAFLVLAPSVIVGELGTLSFLPLAPTTAASLHQLFGFGASAGLVALGIARRLRDCAYAGSVFFVIFLLLRFHDWWWDWMPRYLFFLVIGLTAVAILFALRRLRAAMSGFPEEAEP